MFRVGQRVECIDDGDLGGLAPGSWGDGERIHKGKIYTIARVFIVSGDTLVELREVRRCDQAYAIWGHRGYWDLRFRPVTERKTDISCFTALLNPSPQKVMDELIMETLSDILMANEIHINRFRVQHLHPSDPPANH